MFDTLDLRGQILRLRREHKDRKKDILLDRIRWNKEQQHLAGLIRMTEKTAGPNCLSPIVDERVIEQRKNKLANILQNEKIKTDPTKCVNSEQSSRGSDYMPCRVLDDESEMQDFCRKIRGQAIGILQRSQIIENEQRRKKKEMDEKEQELCWLEELKAKDREKEMNEYVAEVTKKKALHDDIAKQRNLTQ
nr:hypothetical transcript [Hymenolepis microstoma]